LKRLLFLPAAAILAAETSVFAQQLEPRAYSPAPVGMNFIIVPYVYSTGSVVTDPSLPVQNVDARINTVSLGYLRTFSLFGRFASASVLLPYVWGTVSGDVFETHKTVTRSNIGDTQLRFVTNLLGGPALTAKEFASAPPATTLGLSLVVSAPTGQYDGTRLVNIGTNRWAFRPELGVSHPAGHWTLEAYGGAWFFTVNDDYFGGHVRSQATILALQGHVAYTFLPGLWVALDGTWYDGGQSTVDGVVNNDRQKNVRVGVTAAVPLGRAQALKFLWSRGASVRFGQNFTNIGMAYQYRWF